MKELAILIDAFGWAFHHRAIGLKKYLGYGDIFLYTQKEYPDVSQYKRIFQFGHHAPAQIPERTIIHACSFSDFPHLIQTPPKAVCVPNYLLKEHFKSVKSTLVYLPLTVDITHFQPYDRNKNDKLKIAFVGNKHRAVKRYYLFDEMRQRMDDTFTFIETCQKPNRSGGLSYNEMVDFYNEIDVLFSPSKTEGGPYTAFEAGSCKIPTLICSKNTGLYNIGIKDRSLFFCDPYVDSIWKTLLDIDKNRDKLSFVGNNIYDTIITNHSWEATLGIWKQVLSLLDN